MKRGSYPEGANPTKAVSLPSRALRPRQTHAYTLDEVHRVLAQLDDDLETKAIVAVAAFSGLRRSEIQGLRWQDIEEDRINVRHSVFRSVEYEPKSSASRSWVPILPELRGILDAYYADLKAGDEFNIRTPMDSRVFLCTLDHIGRKRVDAAFRRAGLRFAGFHAFRPGLATTMFELGMDDLTVMRTMRHASVQVTRSSYIKIRDAHLENAFAAVQAAIRLRGEAGEDATNR